MNLHRILLTASSLIVSAASAEPVWTTRNPKLSATQFQSIHWDGRKYVGIGSGNESALSSDGQDWRLASGFGAAMPVGAASNSDSVHPLSYVLDVAPPRVLRSSDADFWHKDTVLPSFEYLHSIHWTGKGFILHGTKDGMDTFFVSTNGDGWQSTSLSGFSGKLTGAASNRDVSVVVSYSGAYWSDDEGKWTYSPTSIPGLFGVAFYDSLFVAIQGERKLLSSPDGKVWTERPDWVRKTYSSATETDTLGQDFRQILVANGELILVGTTGAYRTKDFTNWTKDQQIFDKASMVPGNANLWSANGRLFAAGDAGAIWSTTDFVHWNSVVSTLTTSALTSVSAGGPKWVAVGDGGAILVSENGSDWRVVDSKTQRNLRKVRWCSDSYRVLADSSVLLESRDGVDWSGTPLDSVGRLLYDFACSGAKTLVVAEGGVLYSTIAGQGWKQVALPKEDWARQVSTSGAAWVVSGLGSDVMSSTDGVDWKEANGGCSNSAVLSWTGSKFLRSCGFELRSSGDGLAWEEHHRTEYFNWPDWWGVASGGGNGYLFTSIGQLARLVGDTDFVDAGVVGAKINDMALSDSLRVAVGPGGVIKTSLEQGKLSVLPRSKSSGMRIRQEGRKVRFGAVSRTRLTLDLLDLSGKRITTLWDGELSTKEKTVSLPELEGRPVVARLRSAGSTVSIIVVP